MGNHAAAPTLALQMTIRASMSDEPTTRNQAALTTRATADLEP